MSTLKISSLLKHKKILFFALILILFFVINAGTIFAYCDSGSEFARCVCNGGGQCIKKSVLISIGGGDQCHNDSDCVNPDGSFKSSDENALSSDLNAAGKNVAGKAGINLVETASTISGPDSIQQSSFGWTEFFLSIWVAFFRMFLWISYFLAWVTGELFSLIMKWTIDKTITSGASPFIAGWTVIRDLANMLIVLGFVVIGVATSLRIKDYEAKKLLPKLVIIALLINFSGLFCGLIIDASNIIVKNFSGNIQMGSNLVDTFATQGQKTLTNTLAQKNTIHFTKVSLVFTSAYIIIALTFLCLTVIMLARYAILGILYILSPLAFVFMVFPASTKLWTSWREHFLKWVFIGVGTSFFLWLSGAVVEKNPINTKNLSQGFEAVLDLSSIFNLCVATSILVVGLIVTIKSAPGISNAVIGMAKSATGAAWAGTKMAGKGADALLNKASGGKLSASGGMQRLSTGAGRMLERFGLRDRGRTDLMNQPLMKDAEARAAAMSEQDSIAAAKGPARTDAGRKLKFAAIQRAIKEGNLNKIGDTDAQNEAIKWAETRAAGLGTIPGSIRKDAERKNPLLAGFNETTLNKLTAAGISSADAPDVARTDAAGKLNAPQIRDLDAGSITPHLLSGSVDKTLKAAETMSSEQRAKFRAMTSFGSPERLQALTLYNTLMRAGRTTEANNIASHLADARFQAL